MELRRFASSLCFATEFSRAHSLRFARSFARKLTEFSRAHYITGCRATKYGASINGSRPRSRRADEIVDEGSTPRLLDSCRQIELGMLRGLSSGRERLEPGEAGSSVNPVPTPG